MNKLSTSLFFLRISVFLVMFMWTLDKFINAKHAALVYETFYQIADMNIGVLYFIAAVELIIVFGFLVGVFKTFTYGAVLLFHAISTVSTYRQYLAPFEEMNLLFFAALPMLAACLALFLLRRDDTFLSIGK